MAPCFSATLHTKKGCSKTEHPFFVVQAGFVDDCHFLVAAQGGNQIPSLCVGNGNRGCGAILSPRSLNHPPVFPLPPPSSQRYHTYQERPLSSSTQTPGAGSFIACRTGHIINSQISPYKRFLTLPGIRIPHKHRSAHSASKRPRQPPRPSLLYCMCATNL